MIKSHVPGKIRRLKNDQIVSSPSLIERLEVRQLLAAFTPNLGVWNSGTATAYLDYNLTGQISATYNLSPAGSKIVAGDFDGNTVTDLATYNAGTWNIYLNGSTTPNQTVQFGNANTQAVAADVNGDGKADLITFNANKGVVRIDYNTNGVANTVLHEGGPGDTLLAGDLNSDGKADLIFYNAGTWSVDLGADGTIDQTYHFGGAAGDIPVLADLNGSGRVGFGVFNAGNWTFDTNRDGIADREYQFGHAGDMPISGYFDTSNSIFVSPTGSDSNSGSVNAPVATIDKAVALASNGDRIRIAAGVYDQTVYIFGTDNVDFIGAGMDATQINAPSGDTVFLDRDSNVYLYDLGMTSVTTNGRGLVNFGSTTFARAIKSSRNNGDNLVSAASPNGTFNPTLNLKFSHFNASATAFGGDLQNSTTATIANCTFSHNGTQVTAGGNSGRAFGNSATCVVTAKRTNFNANTNGGYYGIQNSTNNLTNCTFNNNANEDGALFSESAAVDISGCDFDTNGNVRDVGGGAIALEFLSNSYEGTATVTGSTFYYNSSGIFVGSGNVSISGNTFDNNAIGVYIDGTTNNTSNATITGNLFELPVGTSSTGLFGGVYALGAKASATVGGNDTSDFNTFDNFGSQTSISSDTYQGGAAPSVTVLGNTYNNSPDPVRLAN